ncbi:uncharacterized protein LOC141691846 [Apium graveolens]|uniref:uncharacterized protein LOC141691846 n=1 Tax=Apium graveolens TaxID=4045 RepID=UPI003D7ADC70
MYATLISTSTWLVLKVNVDAATFEGIGSVGVGSNLRNKAGAFIRTRSKRISISMQTREAETIALKEALTWIKKLGIKKCIFETDSKLLVDACEGVQGRSFFHTIVLNCVQLFKHFEEVPVQFVYEYADVAAHTLVRATLFMSGVDSYRSGAYFGYIDY